MVETITFVVAAGIVLAGAGGVILSRNPVHAALSLVASLFGIAVLFVAQEAHLLAAVQVIVYTGAIVVLILFVLMLLGVDEAEDLTTEPIAGQRLVAVAAGALGLGALAAVLLIPVLQDEPVTDVTAAGEVCEREATFEERVVTGAESQTGAITEASIPDLSEAAGEEAEADPDACGTPPLAQTPTDENVRQLGSVLFTDYVFAFEVTALLLTIAVVGAVVMARRVRDVQPLPPDPEPRRPREPVSDADDEADLDPELEAAAPGGNDA
jgi:NADH-quinone oxidoreductase subunit J